MNAETHGLVDLNHHTNFSGFDYILIDIASQFGHDKLTFPQRLVWAYENFDNFERLANARGHWKERPLYLKSVNTLRRVQMGQPTGAMVGLDAVCSGMQILSVISGCEKGAKSTGMIDLDRCADAYTDCMKAMQRKLPGLASVERKAIKQACMTVLYGSVKEPIKLFGDGTPELNAFYKAMYEIAPGASELVNVLKAAWQKWALNHSWVLPDNHHAEVPVMETIETRVEVDELDHHKFDYEYSINEGCEKGVSLIANVTHSIDGWVLRTMIRRCNYDPAVARNALSVLQLESMQRAIGFVSQPEKYPDQIVTRCKYFARNGIADISIIDYLDDDTVEILSDSHIAKLIAILHTMLEHEPFPIVCIHDEFKASMNNLNDLRKHYKNILADLADSDILNDIVSQITGRPSSIAKKSYTLGEKIRKSNYALC